MALPRLRRCHLAAMRREGAHGLLVWDLRTRRVHVAHAAAAPAWLDGHTPVLAGASALEAIDAEIAAETGRVCDDAALQRLQALAEGVLQEWPRVRPYMADVAPLRAAMTGQDLYLDGPPIRTPHTRIVEVPAPQALHERYRHAAGGVLTVALDLEARARPYVRVLVPPPRVRAEFSLDTGALGSDTAAAVVAAAARAALDRCPAATVP